MSDKSDKSNTPKQAPKADPKPAADPKPVAPAKLTGSTPKLAPEAPAPAPEDKVKIGAPIARKYIQKVVPLGSIKVDPGFNVRKVYDEIEELAADIAAHGLISPLMVRPNVNKQGKQDEKQPWSLMVGFRRHAACTMAKLTEVPVELFDGDEKAALCVNTAENVARKDLRPWEISQRLILLRDKHGLSGAMIGETVGLAKSYANNLIFIEENLIPEIMPIWRSDRQPGVMDMRKIASLTKDEQRAWLAALNGEDTGSGSEEGEEGEGGSGDQDQEDKPQRPGEASIILAISHIEAGIKAGTVPEAIGEPMLKALRWAAGMTKTIPGIFNEEREVEKLKAARVAEREAKRAAEKVEREKKAKEEKAKKAKEKEEAAEAKKLAKEQEQAAKKAEREQAIAKAQAAKDAEKAAAKAKKDAEKAKAEAEKLATKLAEDKAKAEAAAQAAKDAAKAATVAGKAADKASAAVPPKPETKPEAKA